MAASYIERIIPTLTEADALVQLLASFPFDLLAGKSHEAVALAEELGSAQRDLAAIGSKVRGLLEHRGEIGVLDIDLSGVLNTMNWRPPSTPTEHDAYGSHALTPLDVLRCALIGAAGGYSYSYSAQANGNLCDDVMPRPVHRDVGGISSGREVGWHTEDAIFNRGDDNSRHTAWDLVSFAYLRNPTNDPTHVSMPRVGSLKPDVRSALRIRQFPLQTRYAQATESYAIGAPMSLLYGPFDWLRFTFSALSDGIQRFRDLNLLHLVEALIEELEASSDLVDGDAGHVVFLDNMRVAHARRAWKSKPRFDGSDRWQRRLGTASLDRRTFIQSMMDDPAYRIVNSKRVATYLNAIDKDLLEREPC